MKKAMMSLGLLMTTFLLAEPPAQSPPVAPSAPSEAQDPCANLSASFQTFASQLSMQNRALFCSVFTDEQRLAAVQLTTPANSAATPMSADAAVMQIATQNNLMPQSTNSSGGACHLQ